MVVEAALLSRTQRLEQRLMKVEPRVQALLEVLPNKLTADVLEQLRISKQTLVELGSRAGALRQMLLDLLEDPQEIRRICIMGRNCTINKGNDDVECSLPLDKEIADGKRGRRNRNAVGKLSPEVRVTKKFLGEERWRYGNLKTIYNSTGRGGGVMAIFHEHLIFNEFSDLHRCESCHGQAERLLDSAKEMEDSIAVNLSSRRLEVSRVELLLQVGTFCVAVGALVAVFGGGRWCLWLQFAFWLTTAGIIVGAVVAFFLMYSYLRDRRIL
ncbi:Magnesium transporter MRS2-11, chloroplastic, partial [Cucurbita argyrosperma subsp. argyrosperma]